MIRSLVRTNCGVTRALDSGISGYGRLCTPIGQNLVHLVSVSVDKQSAIRAVPVERNEMVIRLALHGTFAQGYGRLYIPRVIPHAALVLAVDVKMVVARQPEDASAVAGFRFHLDSDALIDVISLHFHIAANLGYGRLVEHHDRGDARLAVR